MNYIYDILINYNSFLYDIYEWNKDDDIIHLRKIPFFHLDKITLFNFINYKVKVDSSFLNKIIGRTELFTRNNVVRLDYCFLGCDGEEVVSFKLDKNGYIIGYSKLLLEEEMEALEYVNNVEPYPIKYEMGSKISYDFKTREERKIKQYINQEIKKIIRKKDYDKLEYLYYDCFDEWKKKETIKENIYNEIEQKWDDVYLKLYRLLKITNK